MRSLRDQYLPIEHQLKAGRTTGSRVAGMGMARRRYLPAVCRVCGTPETKSTSSCGFIEEVDIERLALV